METDTDGLIAAVEATTDAIAVVGDDGSFRYVNRPFAELVGHEPDEDLSGCDWRDCFTDETVAVLEETIGNSVAVSGEWRGELELHTTAGGSVVGEASVVGLDEGGYAAVVRDVSHRRAREHRLEHLLESTRDLYRAASRDAVASTVVETAEEVLDLPLVGVWYLSGRELHPAAMSDQGEQLVGRGVFTPGESLAWEAFADGETHVYENLAEAPAVHNPDTPLESEVVVPVGEFGVVCCGATERVAPDSFDVRLVELLAANAAAALDRLDREGELERQNRRLEQFTGVVSHDLRSPLSVARGRLELARENGDPEDFRRVSEALERMDRLIDELLTLAREGSQVEEPTPVGLASVARSAWEMTETGDADLSVADDRTVPADHERLRRLLENLFRNAVEHGSTSPPSQAREDAVEHGSTSNRTGSDDAVEHGPADVTVEVGPLSDGFYVADDGPGIPEDVHEQVFEPGHTTGGGTGFGLSIVARIADAHGWSVGVTESEDGGARFEIRGVDEE